MAALFLAALFTVFSTGYCGNYTVTDEVWFDIEVKDFDGPGEDYTGRFVIALFGETAPMTTMNFAAIARGYKRGKERLHYKNSKVHRIVPDFVVQMGDITVGDGTGGESIYGPTFVDEEFILSHRAPSYVSMANHGPDTNGSQFFVLLTRARWLDGKHVVFGKVVRGFDVIETLHGLEPKKPRGVEPKSEVTIVDCGVVEGFEKYDLKEDQLDSTEDI